MRGVARVIPALGVSLLLLPGPVHGVVMEEQIKFDVSSPWILGRILALNSILSYRAKTIGHFLYRDYYYDTPDYAVCAHGYSYRLRVRDKGNGALEYGLQFKREYAVGGEGYVRMEIDDIMLPETGRRIAAGAWADALSPAAAPLRTVRVFREFLAREKLDPAACAPRLSAEQERDRIRLTESGTTWFEISLDTGALRPLGEGGKEPFRFRQLELENKSRGADPGEVRRRIRALVDFFSGYSGITMTRESKYKSAVEHFAHR